MEKKKRPIDDENLDQVTGGTNDSNKDIVYCKCLNPVLDENEDQSGPYRTCTYCGGIVSAILVGKNLSGRA